MQRAKPHVKNEHNKQRATLLHTVKCLRVTKLFSGSRVNPLVNYAKERNSYCSRRTSQTSSLPGGEDEAGLILSRASRSVGRPDYESKSFLPVAYLGKLEERLNKTDTT